MTQILCAGGGRATPHKATRPHPTQPRPSFVCWRRGRGQDIPYKATQPHPSFVSWGPGHLYKATLAHPWLIADAVSAPARSREAAAAERERRTTLVAVGGSVWLPSLQP